MNDSKNVRLVTSAAMLLCLAVPLLAAIWKGNEGLATALGASVVLAVQNFLNQFSTEKAAEKATVAASSAKAAEAKADVAAAKAETTAAAVADKLDTLTAEK